jgi:SAM-dependent methyltransferase
MAGSGAGHDDLGNAGDRRMAFQRWQVDRLAAAITILAGALLLFEVEPLIAKAILPWFGGSAQVWTSCLLFFQVALLIGYLYAHMLTTRIAPRWQWRIHAGLLAASLVFLPIVPAEHWKPTGGEDPLPQILGLLTTTIGLPFVLLSATSPLVQAWLARPVEGTVRPPYRLFALSNFGSMVALLSYPLLVEPYVPGHMQAIGWSMLYAGFAVTCSLTAWRYRGGTLAPRAKIDNPSWSMRVLWFFLAAVPSALLLAMTNFMLQNIAAIPLFWVVPLALYLASFILAFNSLKWFALPAWYVLFVLALGVALAATAGYFSDYGLLMLPVLSGVLFVFCCVSHGELSLARPEPKHLTEYYLIISTGGAAGGLFVAAVAPAVFNAPYELPILLPLTALIVLVAASRHYREWTITRQNLLAITGLLVIGISGWTMAKVVTTYPSTAVLLTRNFYGALKVQDTALTETNPVIVRRLINGSILHGIEVKEPRLRRTPLSYYARPSGIGRVIAEAGKRGAIRVGVIGQGIGTLAGYGRTGDTYRFYEINPAVDRIARDQFWYLATNPAHQSVVIGDGRLSLEREPPQDFDVLVIDAFLSDSIPLHLLTREAFSLYWRHLKPGGVLAVHVSNRYIALAPVVAQDAAARGLEAREIDIYNDLDHGVARSVWVLVTRRKELFRRGELANIQAVPIPAGLRPWTDDYSAIWSVLRF